MVRSWPLTAVWLAAAGVSSTWAATVLPSTEKDSNTFASSLIIECQSSQEMESLAKSIQDAGGEVFDKFNSRFFRGISVRNITSDMDMKALTEGFDVWPESEIHLEVDGEAGKQAKQNKRRYGQHDSTETEDKTWHLAMTQVDKMHKAGFTGNGIKVAIVDTGVDYTHEALGGCFGTGCRVAFGDNFADDGKKGDPMDCDGHGTALAGMVGGFSKTANFVGVAPNVTLMAYRSLDCNHTGTDSSVMNGWLKAAEDGAHIIVSATGVEDSWSQTLLARTVARIADSGIVCINAIGNAPNKGPFYAASPSTGRGVISVSSFSKSFIGDKFASYGPTWDLDIKPSLGAPGQNVTLISMGNKYRAGSGTSFASPLVAGIAALVADALGVSNFDAAQVRSRLMTTAKPKQVSVGVGLISVIQQGGGLIDAWDAAHASTVVEPPSLAFNDTEHRVPSISLRITNMAKSEVTYQLSSQHASTLYTAQPSFFEPDPIKAEPVEAPADIKLSQDSLTLGPGLSGTIEVTAADPSGLDLDRLPIWSGWVVVNGTDGSSLTVPYLGLAGSLRSAGKIYPCVPVLKVNGTDGKPIFPGANAFVFEDPPSGQRPEPSNSIMQKDAGKSVKDILVAIHLPISSSRLRLDIVPLDLCSSSPGSNPQGASQAAPDLSKACVPDDIVSEFAGTKSIGQLPRFPMSYVDRRTDEKPLTRWNGTIASGQYAPPGRYKFALHALSHFGNADNESDWETTPTGEFSIAYEHNIINP